MKDLDITMPRKEFLLKPIPHPVSGPNPRPKRRSLLLLTQVILLILILAGSGVSYYFYKNSNSNNSSLIKEVGKIIILPETEIPRIATVTDPKVLSDQPFFKNAIVGDKVLLYLVAQRAILYRPSVHKIVEVMPFTLPPELKQ